MAARLDVAARLAEGRPAVEHTQSYVWACHLLGYWHPELTASDSQVRDCYDSEVGLDLRVLDSDCVHLRSAVQLAEEAARRAQTHVAALAGAWMGPGAEEATRFLERHCAAAQAVVAGVRAAAQGCDALRDSLWQTLDRKVTTAVAIDDRRLVERPAWLAAAQVVTAGVGDRSAATGLIQQQVEPYVANDIRGEWLTEMQFAAAAVERCFDGLTDSLTAPSSVRFEIPAEFRPGVELTCSPTELRRPVPRVPATAAPVIPAAAQSEPPSSPAAAPPWGTAFGDGSAMPMGGGFSGLDGGSGGNGLVAVGGSGGLGGLVERIIATMGDLVGSAGDPLDDSAAVDRGALDETDAVDRADDGAPAVGPEGPVGSHTGDAGAEVTALPAGDGSANVAADELPAPGATSPPAAALPLDGPADPPPQTAPASGRRSEEGAPCDIPADELPQVGR